MKTKPSGQQIERAAVKWCGDRDRETFEEDMIYFRHMWWCLPGLKKYVEREVNES